MKKCKITWTHSNLILISCRIIIHDIGILICNNIRQILNLLSDPWLIALLQLQLLRNQLRIITDSLNPLLLQLPQEINHILLRDRGHAQFLDYFGFDLDGHEYIFQVLFDQPDCFQGFLVLDFQDLLSFFLLLDFVHERLGVIGGGKSGITIFISRRSPSVLAPFVLYIWISCFFSQMLCSSYSTCSVSSFTNFDIIVFF